MPSRTEPFRADRPAVVELAAGAVVAAHPTAEVLLLHEPLEDRWCLPKGHVEAGESMHDAALREIREETGLEGIELGPELEEVHYRFFDPKRELSVLKTSVYFLATTPSRTLRLEPTFDGGRWLPAPQARSLLPFEGERSVITAAMVRLPAIASRHLVPSVDAGPATGSKRSPRPPSRIRQPESGIPE